MMMVVMLVLRAMEHRAPVIKKAQEAQAGSGMCFGVFMILCFYGSGV